MEDFSTIIYILIALFAAFGGLLKKKKKTSSMPNIMDQLEYYDNPEDEYESDLEEKTVKSGDALTEYKNDELTKTKEKPDLRFAAKNSSTSVKNLYSERKIKDTHQKTKDIFQKEKAIIPQENSLIDDDESFDIEEIISSDFDIRRAVIYSEILNRKSF